MLMIFLPTAQAAQPLESGTPMTLTTPSAILAETATGTVIFEKNADERREVASITKLMTAMLLSMSALAESVTLTDMTGHEITIDEPVTRIVVLQPSDAEILCALGAQDTIVGRGTYVDYPETILEVPVVASGSNTNIEEILALNPQVVVMTTMSQTEEQIAALEQAGVKVVVSSAQDIAGVYTAITLLGELVDKNDEAAALIANMKAAFADVAEKAAAANVSGKTVYFEISPLPYGIWSAGQGTFMDELATLCGVTNVFHDQQRWFGASEEQVIAANPDYIITTTNYMVNNMDGVTEICSRAGWEDVTAVKEGPYVQYTHTRCCSVLRKAAEMSLPEADMNALTDDEAQALLRLLGRFPDVIKEAAEKYEPSMITRAVTDIAQAYNKFYYEHRILDGEPATAAARVALTKATKDVIKTGLWLIGIEAPERM